MNETAMALSFVAREGVGQMMISVCSPLSAATNGATLRVDGGVVRSPFWERPVTLD
jgi:enoyl-[acyl-carrier-protein] reductase (NADH)